MKFSKYLLVFLIVLSTAVSLSTHQVRHQSSPAPIQRSSTVPQTVGQHAVAAYGELPLSFEANHGRTDPQVKFLSRGRGYSLLLTNTEAIIALKKNRKHTLDIHETQSVFLSRSATAETQESSEPKILRMQLAGANASRVAGAEELPGKVNYFIGSNPAKWRTNVATYAEVKYENVYPGVDLVYYGNQGQLEYDFVVAPGADPNRIELKFRDAGRLRVSENGDLLLGASGEVRFQKPAMYQTINGQRRAVESRYVVAAADLVRFGLGDYDHTQALVIDPVLSYSTYLGGTGDEGGNAIAVDASGNAYITGETTSNPFPTTSGAFQTIFSGLAPVFVSKINASGSALVYSTYLGGSQSEIGYGIAVDASGNAYITGETRSTNFPTVNPVQAALGAGGFQNAFVSKLNASGSALVYSTYLGGGGIDQGNGIAVDSSGNAYVVGQTSSTNFPTVNAIQPALGGTGASNAFVTKFNSSGSALVYSTYLGGSSRDGGKGIALDSSGNAYVVGQTNSTNFPTLNAIQPALGGTAASNAFVTKFNSSGSALVYSTYLGGSASDGANGIAVDASGNVYVTGSTISTDFPTVNAFQPAPGTSNGRYFGNAFVSKLNSTGSALVYSTYLGGGASPSQAGDAGNAIAVDASGQAYVTGETATINFPTLNAFQSTFAGIRTNVFVSVFSSAGSALVFSTYLGGGDGNGDRGLGIAVDASANVYVTGATGASNFPTANALQPTSGGNNDAFIAKISSISGSTAPTSTSLASSLNPSKVGQLVTFTATVAGQVSGTPTGVVAFYDGATSLGTGTLNASVQATLLTSLGQGTHSVVAIYQGDATFSGSSSAALSQVVLPGQNNGPSQTTTTTVGTGTGPAMVAVNPITNKIYVANTFGNTVTIIDGFTNATSTVTVGTNPVALAVNTATNKIYVVDVGSSDVTVIDGATNATITVPVGTSPYAVAVNSVTNKVYVTNHQGNSVTVIDGVTNGTVTVSVGTHPYAVAVNPVSNKVYVTNQDGNNVTVIDGASNSATTVADPNALAPIAVSVNPVTDKIYVVNQGSNNVTVIDGLANSTTTVNGVVAGSAVAANSVTNKIYVTNGGGANSVTVIDGATNSITAVSVGSTPKGVAVDAVRNKIYVADSGSNNVSAIDGATNVVITLSDSQAAGTASVAVNPVTNKIYAANNGSNNVTVIDGSTYSATTVSNLNTWNPQDVAVNPVTNKIYVANFYTNFGGGTISSAGNVMVIDGATNSATTVADPKAIGSNAVAVNPVTNKIYVANSGSNLTAGNVTVIDGATNATTTITDPNGGNPEALAVNPVTNKIYVANYSSNNVTVIDGATNAFSTVSAGQTPSAVAVNPVTNKIYVTNYFSNNITVIDGATNATTTVADPNAVNPTVLAVNPVTNKIYTANYGSNNVTVIDGGTNATTTVTDPQSSGSVNAIAVNPLTNRVYAASYSTNPGNNLMVIDGATNTITSLNQPGAFFGRAAINPATNKIYVTDRNGANVMVLDGATNATTTVTTTNVTTPFSVAVNPVTGTIYVANAGSNNAMVITDAQVQPVPLTTAITPLSGNQTAGPTQAFNFTATSSFTPPRAVFFQVDNWQTPWQPTSGTSPNFAGTATGLTAGTHILYAFATDGQDANSTGVAQQLTGSISGYLFNVVPPVSKPFATATSVSSSENTANQGDSVTFTATVGSQDLGPTGTVTFLDGATTLGTATLNAAAQATFTTASLASGTHSITARYGGDSNFAASTSAAFSQDISTLQSITVSPNPASVPHNSTVQLTAAGHYADGSTGTLTTLATWSSSNTTVATVSSVGLAFGSTAGLATTITASHGTISGTTQLIVTLDQPTVNSFLPGAGSGITQKFDIVVGEFSGLQNLNQVQLLFNTSPARLSGCNVYYVEATNTLNLYNDSGSGFVGGVTPGSATQVSNSQCTLGGAGFTATSNSSSNQLTLGITLTFSGAFTGLRNAYAYVQGNNGTNNGGWQQVGTWTVPNQPPAVVSFSPNSGTGVTQTFTVVAGDPAGAADLNQVQLLFNTSPARLSGCNVYYVQATNTLNLYNDSGSAFAGGVTPGSATQVSNSQCTLSGAGSSATTSGNNLTLNVALTSTSTFLGLKNTYVYVQGNNGLNNGGWKLEGTWTPGQSPTVVSLTPSLGTGFTQTFTAVASDPAGTADLNQVQLLFNATATRLSGCNVFYQAATNTLYLYSDSGSGFLGGVTPGSATQVSNSQCTLSGAGSSASTSGNNLTLGVALTFSGTFTGSKNVYGYVQGNNGSNNGGWVQKGTWTP